MKKLMLVVLMVVGCSSSIAIAEASKKVTLDDLIIKPPKHDPHNINNTDRKPPPLPPARKIEVKTPAGTVTPTRAPGEGMGGGFVISNEFP